MNLLKNPNFDEGYYHQDNLPEIVVPNHWYLYWIDNEIFKGAGGIAYRPESVVWNIKDAPSREKFIFFLSGRYCWAVFKAGTPLYFAATQAVFGLTPGATYRFNARVYPHIVTGYSDGEKIRTSDIWAAEARAGWSAPNTPWPRAEDGDVAWSNWFNMYNQNFVFEKYNDVWVEFQAPASGEVRVWVECKAKWGFENNWLMNSFSLLQVSEAPLPTMPPAPPGPPPAPGKGSFTEMENSLRLSAPRPDLLARLDVAVPEQVYLQRTFDVAAAVRLPDSPLLDEDGLLHVKSGDARIFWPASQDHVRMCLQIIAPECQIVGDDQATFLLPKGADSPVFYFSLIPLHLGPITIIVKLWQEYDVLGNARVRTTAVAQVAGEVRLALTSQAVPVDVDFSPWAIATAAPPPGLPPALNERLRLTLSQSPHLASNAALHTLFVDARLAPWRDHIPDNTPSRAARVNALIHTLYDKTRVTGENALALLLYTLADYTDPADILHHDLSNLAIDFERELMKDLQ
ncbi:MAG: hypothetical protein JXA21_22005 [Anaerolineae bacterium]|nr:hypothetical protein [Anaerolineae bacterium]